MLDKQKEEKRLQLMLNIEERLMQKTAEATKLVQHVQVSSS